jgi:hypothetical protein
MINWIGYKIIASLLFSIASFFCIRDSVRYVNGMKILIEFNESHDYDKFIKDVRKFNKDVGLVR